MTLHTASHLLTREAHKTPRQAVRFAEGLDLATGRVHEFCGGARRTLALMVAGAMAGPVFWIAPSWMRGGLNPEGMLDLADPARFIFVAPKRPEDLLWCLEEVLRSGAVPLAVADLPAPPGLTAVRRLHLAAEAGAAASASGRAPLGLLLTPEAGGAPGVETRWQLEPRHTGETAESWHLARLRARQAPPATWPLTRGRTGIRLGAALVAD